ncbi:MAG: rubrerythrin family protein [Nitrospirales bacterium]|nr:MAG: rubrerythrin family protein [Nitrospirales bacterium]
MGVIMKKRIFRYLVIVFLTSVFLLPFARQPALAENTGDPSNYPLTVKALNARYIDEVIARNTYNAYATRAHSEGYQNIAFLFTALAASESIHARNFEALLTKLGVPLPEVIEPRHEVLSTKENLHHATAVEAEEIDTEYPKIIGEITAEGHEAAIRNITYAWKAEKQHRDLMRRIQKNVKRWFSLVAKFIEREPARYYVCDICGSTLVDLPKDRCPICNNPVSHYEEVKRMR